MIKLKQRPHIIGVKSTSAITEPLLKKHHHKVLPDRFQLDFKIYVHNDRNVVWAHPDQCHMIFPAIDNNGDYWCGNLRDHAHEDRYKQQYC